MNFKRLYIALVSVLMVALSSLAAPTVAVKLDSVALQMGRMTTLHVTVTQPKAMKGHFPLFSTIKENGIIPVCGDSVELRLPSRVDTVAEGENIRINLEIPVQAFDSGYYRLPQLDFVAGQDTVKSNSLALKVYPVNATADTPIGDFASVADPADPSFFDFLPDWVIDFWWLILAIILLAIAILYAMRRYRKEGSLLPKKPLPSSYEEAIRALHELRQQKLWEQGQEKQYYTDLTDILRRYLWRRFGINAVEMTSRQILQRLSANKDTADKRDYFRQILDMADFVKFAKVRPLPDDNVLAFDNALRFVEETKPVAVEQDDTTDKTPAGKPSENKMTESERKSKKGPVAGKGGEK